eukprot:3280933-Rhodomonas_salina.1
MAVVVTASITPVNIPGTRGTKNWGPGDSDPDRNLNLIRETTLSCCAERHSSLEFNDWFELEGPQGRPGGHCHGNTGTYPGITKMKQLPK